MADITTVVVGGLFGLLGGLAGGWLKSRADRAAWERSRNDAVALQAVALIRDLATTVAAAAHSMCWLCWKAKFSPSAVTAETVAAYDAEMHELLPKVFGAHAGLAAISPESAKRLGPVMSGLASMDAQIGEACVGIPKGSVAKLAGLHDGTIVYPNEAVAVLTGTAQQLLVGASSLLGVRGTATL